MLKIILILANTAFSQNVFNTDEYLQKRVDFWMRVYTEISTKEGFLHDEDDLNIVYEKINTQGLSEKQRVKKIKQEKKRWSEVIISIIKKKQINLSPEEKKIVNKLENLPKKRLFEMARDIRFQSGLSDRYFHGLQESYKYLGEIREEFRDMGLPQELAYLPHVESSFNYKAYSKVGAVGIWQFMWGTARLYKLKKNHLIDERRDPLISTMAAAKLLKDNFKRFKSWPLAITAYNCGPINVAKAIIKTRSRDLSEILKKYEGGRFGFASKNFYATFLAVKEISENPKKYFKEFQKRSHPPFEIYKLPENSRISHISKVFSLDNEEIEIHNLSLRPYVFKKDLILPKGFELKIPKNVFENAKIAKISEEKTSKKLPVREITSNDKTLFKIMIEPDETLGHLADWSLVPPKKILELNRSLKMTVGIEVLLPISGKTLDRFLSKRSQYHLSIRKNFFKKFKVEGVSQYEVKKGDTLEKLTGELEVPLWLIKKYQKKEILKVGDTLEIPRIVSVNGSKESLQMQNQ